MSNTGVMVLPRRGFLPPAGAAIGGSAPAIDPARARWWYNRGIGCYQIEPIDTTPSWHPRPDLDVMLYMQVHLLTDREELRIVSDKHIINDMACNCLMGRARLLARVITGIYDEVLLPFGLKASQLNLLVVVAQEGPVRRADVGRLLHLDRSTLTRNLQVMLKNDWISEVQDHSDARGLPLKLTRKGATLLAEVAPAWKQAQRRAEALLGNHGISVLKNVSGSLLGAG